jgi:hypothetical protein
VHFFGYQPLSQSLHALMLEHSAVERDVVNDMSMSLAGFLAIS